MNTYHSRARGALYIARLACAISCLCWGLSASAQNVEPQDPTWSKLLAPLNAERVSTTHLLSDDRGLLYQVSLKQGEAIGSQLIIHERYQGYWIESAPEVLSQTTLSTLGATLPYQGSGVLSFLVYNREPLTEVNPDTVNPRELQISQRMNQEVHYKIFREHRWSEAATIPGTRGAVELQASVHENGSMCVAYWSDADGDQTTRGDVRFSVVRYDGQRWSAARELSQERPLRWRVSALADSCVAVWNRFSVVDSSAVSELWWARARQGALSQAPTRLKSLTAGVYSNLNLGVDSRGSHFFWMESDAGGSALIRRTFLSNNTWGGEERFALASPIKSELALKPYRVASGPDLIEVIPVAQGNNLRVIDLREEEGRRLSPTLVNFDEQSMSIYKMETLWLDGALQISALGASALEQSQAAPSGVARPDAGRAVYHANIPLQDQLKLRSVVAEVIPSRADELFNLKVSVENHGLQLEGSLDCVVRDGELELARLPIERLDTLATTSLSFEVSLDSNSRAFQVSLERRVEDGELTTFDRNELTVSLLADYRVLEVKPRDESTLSVFMIDPTRAQNPKVPVRVRWTNGDGLDLVERYEVNPMKSRELLIEIPDMMGSMTRYQVEIVVNPERTIRESDYRNNGAIYRQALSPDFTIDQLFLEDGDLTLIVKNIGSDVAWSGEIDVLVEPYSSGNAGMSARSPITQQITINQAESRHTIDLDVFSNTFQSLYVTLNPSGAHGEVSRNNNRKRVEFSAVEITPVTLSINVKEIRCQVAELCVQVVGERDLSLVKLDLKSENDVVIDRRSIPVVAAGGEVCQVWEELFPGDYTLDVSFYDGQKDQRVSQRFELADVDFDDIHDVCDNCVGAMNMDQNDADNDQIGDACDVCAQDPYNDVDGDSICGDVDNCPADQNANQLDTDRDGFGDVCDICPNDPLVNFESPGACASAERPTPTMNVEDDTLEDDSSVGGSGCDCDAQERSRDPLSPVWILMMLSYLMYRRARGALATPTSGQTRRVSSWWLLSGLIGLSLLASFTSRAQAQEIVIGTPYVTDNPDGLSEGVYVSGPMSVAADFNLSLEMIADPSKTDRYSKEVTLLACDAGVCPDIYTCAEGPDVLWTPAEMEVPDARLVHAWRDDQRAAHGAFVPLGDAQWVYVWEEIEAVNDSYAHVIKAQRFDYELDALGDVFLVGELDYMTHPRLLDQMYLNGDYGDLHVEATRDGQVLVFKTLITDRELFDGPDNLFWGWRFDEAEQPELLTDSLPILPPAQGSLSNVSRFEIRRVELDEASSRYLIVAERRAEVFRTHAAGIDQGWGMYFTQIDQLRQVEWRYQDEYIEAESAYDNYEHVILAHDLETGDTSIHYVEDLANANQRSTHFSRGGDLAMLEAGTYVQAWLDPVYAQVNDTKCYSYTPYSAYEGNNLVERYQMTYRDAPADNNCGSDTRSVSPAFMEFTNAWRVKLAFTNPEGEASGEWIASGTLNAMVCDAEARAQGACASGWYHYRPSVVITDEYIVTAWHSADGISIRYSTHDGQLSGELAQITPEEGEIFNSPKLIASDDLLSFYVIWESAVAAHPAAPAPFTSKVNMLVYTGQEVVSERRELARFDWDEGSPALNELDLQISSSEAEIYVSWALSEARPAPEGEPQREQQLFVYPLSRGVLYSDYEAASDQPMYIQFKITDEEGTAHCSPVQTVLPASVEDGADLTINYPLGITNLARVPIRLSVSEGSHPLRTVEVSAHAGVAYYGHCISSLNPVVSINGADVSLQALLAAQSDDRISDAEVSGRAAALTQEGEDEESWVFVEELPQLRAGGELLRATPHSHGACIEYRARARNVLGEEYTTRHGFELIDLEEPYIQYTERVEGGQWIIDLERVNDPASSLASVDFVYNGESQSIYRHSEAYNVMGRTVRNRELSVALRDGLNRATIRATDRAGNTREINLIKSYEDPTPRIAIRSPQSGVTYAESIPLLYETNVELDEVIVWVDRAPRANLEGLEDGAHTVQVTGLTQGNLVVSELINFEVNVNRDAVLIRSPLNMEYTKNLVSVLYQTNFEVGEALMRLDGGAWTQVRGLTNLADGEHTLEVKATNVNGDEVTQGVTFSVRNITPLLNIESPVHGATYYEADLELLFESNSAVSYQLEGTGSFAANSGDLISGLESGRHTLLVTATNEIGEQVSEQVSFNVDLVDLDFALVSPVSSIYKRGEIPFEYRSNKALRSLDLVINGDPTQKLAELEPGLHELVVTATDLSGRTSEDRVSFHVVEFDFLTPNEGEVIDSETIPTSVNVQYLNEGLEEIYVRVDSGRETFVTVMPGEDVLSVPVPGGNHTIYLTGKIGDDEITISRDVTVSYHDLTVTRGGLKYETDNCNEEFTCDLTLKALIRNIGNSDFSGELMIQLEHMGPDLSSVMLPFNMGVDLEIEAGGFAEVQLGTIRAQVGDYFRLAIDPDSEIPSEPTRGNMIQRVYRHGQIDKVIIALNPEQQLLENVSVMTRMTVQTAGEVAWVSVQAGEELFVDDTAEPDWNLVVDLGALTRYDSCLTITAWSDDSEVLDSEISCHVVNQLDMEETGSVRYDWRPYYTQTPNGLDGVFMSQLKTTDLALLEEQELLRNFQNQESTVLSEINPLGQVRYLKQTRFREVLPSFAPDQGALPVMGGVWDVPSFGATTIMTIGADFICNDLDVKSFTRDDEHFESLENDIQSSIQSVFDIVNNAVGDALELDQYIGDQLVPGFSIINESEEEGNFLAGYGVTNVGFATNSSVHMLTYASAGIVGVFDFKYLGHTSFEMEPPSIAVGDVEINHNSEVTGCNAQLEDQVLTSEVRARSELSLEIPFIFNTGSMSLDHTGGFYASTGFAVDFLLSLIGLPGLTAFGIIDFEVELIEQRIEIPFQLRAALELGVGGPRRGVAQAELGMRIAAHHEANPVVSGDFDMLMIAFYIPFTGDAELNSEMSFNLDAKAKVSLGTNGVETQAYSSFEYFVFAELSPVRACALGVFCFEAADRQILIDQRPAPTFTGEDFEFGFDLTEADRNGD